MTITFLPDTGEHVLVLLSTAANGDQEWGCGECGHTRMINFDPEHHRNECTQYGDFSVKHCMGASCDPEMDHVLKLNLSSHNTDDVTPIKPRDPTIYSGCGIRWKAKEGD